ncbi:5'-methylthioadenosine/adenosylhomocysteine nucleosidase [Gorillibacterium timonense]|uniref:5'-methylthioadenosine/adenosylhomocysteine nucleosidase n=1 Tax=Gorillibacterium timonense TaxID=1689269 RepID=UPI00071C2062|nr:5'-methylthioadenosine/adenosylhomocysteine nucleosidase [Gorillibacterium timonense]
MKYGLIGAMDEEVTFFHEHLKDTSVTRYAGITFYEGRFQGKQVVLCKCGVGKVNAAICTQVLIDRYAVKTILFTGVAGALAPDLEVGDVVVSVECMQHDMDVSPLGYPRGIIPYQELSIFPADKQLVQVALEVGEERFHRRIKSGRILSGDQFVANRDTVENLHREMNGICAEMEGASVAQVCAMNGIPYIVIRSMSDKADGSAPDNYAAFTQKAAKNSYQMIEGLLGRL